MDEEKEITYQLITRSIIRTAEFRQFVEDTIDRRVDERVKQINKNMIEIEARKILFSKEFLNACSSQENAKEI